MIKNFIKDAHFYGVKRRNAQNKQGQNLERIEMRVELPKSISLKILKCLLSNKLYQVIVYVNQQK